jgi:hypothetical protein
VRAAAHLCRRHRARGERNFAIDNLAEIAAALGLSLSELLDFATDYRQEEYEAFGAKDVLFNVLPISTSNSTKVITHEYSFSHY